MHKKIQKTYLSTAYLPPISYFTKILASEDIIIEQHENYIKQSYRTRCNIYSANGVISLSIPIERPHSEKVKIKDIKIDYKQNWQHTHWQSIISAYQMSPFFEFYKDDFAPFFFTQENFLFDFNLKLLTLLLDLSSIKANIKLSDAYIDNPEFAEFDYRFSISPKARLQKPDPYFKATRYYQVFEQKHGFIENLSIFDLLCNEGNNTISILQESVLGH